MIIKEFQLFESNNLDKFPSIEEVKSYFYDFTDELNTFIDDYDYGYLYFMDHGHAVPGNWNSMVDILDTCSNIFDLLKLLVFLFIHSFRL